MAYLHKHPSALAIARGAKSTRAAMALRANKEINRFNTLALIRWVFENRPLIKGERHNAIYRLCLRMRYKKQMKYITDAATVVTHTITAVGHARNVLYKMACWKGEVVKCQRMIRRALIRRDQHLFLVLSHVKEYTAKTILREMISGVTSLFPRGSSFSERREMQFANHKDIKLSLIRTEDRKNYELRFPGLPLWIAMALEKLSNELIKAYSVLHSVTLKPPKVFFFVVGRSDGNIVFMALEKLSNERI